MDSFIFTFWGMAPWVLVWWVLGVLWRDAGRKGIEGAWRVFAIGVRVVLFIVLTALATLLRIGFRTIFGI